MSISCHATHLIFLILILILGSCRSSPWIYQSVCSDHPQFNSSQMTHTAQNPFQEIEVQILNGAFGRVVFFNTLCGALQNDRFTLEIQNKQYHFRGTIMEGNQRLQLPPEAANQLIEAIFKGYEVTAIMDHYYATLSPIKNFKLFKKQHILLWAKYAPLFIRYQIEGIPFFNKLNQFKRL